ncbi:phosphatidylinositol glycan, class U [Cryptococcus bacillisporus CA1873]|uniref:Phosphatidylinositol glycan, class U n=3 Tax=Cryptococcus gattii TaxID=552467 RepID=A0A0D0VMS6_CRYGA|nr:phosphatidylinositol glycan, class U [Cryptococcus bacillisporus CA1280]KIR69356.1 phosphatidylinositol glycan, class U [Cryptococcus bacillisporus CA1873]|eukprot:KIR69356.1 phosphatidylinositol glycan, class U [Cryptococcus gattii CA1873]
MSYLERLRSYEISHSQVFIAGAVLRMALFALPEVVMMLQRRPELSTPLTSFRSMKEGVFIYQHGSNPYSGGTFYHSPIYLSLFSQVIPISSVCSTAAIWTLADLWGAWSLVKISRARNQKRYTRDALIAAVYLLNPYSLLTCIARSTTALDNAVLLGALSAAATGNATFSLISLAVAAHTSFYPIILLAPIIILLGQTDPKQTKKALVLQSLLLFVTSTIAIGVFNFLILGDNWIWKSLGTSLEVTNLTPNVGMWWYFFTEMFDHFRTFFLGVFQLHTVIYIAPICIRMVDRPLDSILLLLAIFVTWKSFPALGDMGLCAGLIGCFPDILANLRHPLFSLTVHLYTSILLPLLHSLWLLTGTGNANFFYAATMVYGLNASLVIVDMLGASMRVEVKERVTLERASDQSGEQDKKECIDSVCENWEVRKWHAVQFTK